MGVELSHRYNIESLAYILMYFIQGSLPWQAAKCQANFCIKELSVNSAVLCNGLPIAFKKCLKYAFSLGFSECPDYQYLYGLFTYLHQQHDDSEFLGLGTTLQSSTPSLLIAGSDSAQMETLPIQKC